MKPISSFAVLASVLMASVVAAQQTKPLTIQEAVANSGRFPAVTAAEEQVNAAAAGIRLARTNYLPSIDATGQINRATRNNVFGLLLPQAVIPSMSGPVLGTNNGGTAWGSAAGVLISWQPFDFGQRRAQVRSAEAARNRAEFSLERSKFETEAATAAAFLTLLASEQTVRAAQAAVERAQTVVRSVSALVTAKLRAGADLSRANTELEAAQTQLLQAQQAREVAKTSLAEFAAADFKTLAVAPGHLLDTFPDVPTGSRDVANNPAAKEQAGAVEESRARLAVLERSYRPTFELQAAGYGRGSGALTNGLILGGANGLAPNYFNAGAGFTVNFPLFALPSVRAQAAKEEALGRSAAATYRRVLADLQQQSNAANATLQQARLIAAETPKEVQDARTGFTQASAQYHAGLSTIVAVAEAERLLTQAEIDDSLAKLAVWRAWLEIEIAQGDISQFLSEAGR